MTGREAQRVRCPCCGEIFALADAEYVDDTPAQTTLPMQPEGSLPVTIVFDGGSIGNPGRGYGSYQLTVRGKAEAPKRIELGDRYTNNEAEYDTLVTALEAVARRAKDPARVRLDIRGDSQLVINQLNGVWKAKDPRMRERLQRVRTLLNQFAGWKATWHERGKSVEALGH
jgi:probable phosphoglycerate mutase